MIQTKTGSSSNTTVTPLFSADYRIYIKHTDAGGIVYHANHLVFFENCRRDWFTQLGLDGYFIQNDDGQIQHFVVSQAQLQYRKAILLDEIINVRIDKVELKPASIIFHQSIHRDMTSSTDKKEANAVDSLLSSTKIVIACVQNQVMPESTSDSESAAPITVIKPIRVPKKLHSVIQQSIIEHNDM